MDQAFWQKRADSIVKRILASLPQELAQRAGDCRIVLNWHAPEGVSEDLLGCFEGPALHESPVAGVEGLPVITLCLRNIAEYCDYEAGAFDEEVEVTLLHELGHYFGWDEDDIEERGLD